MNDPSFKPQSPFVRAAGRCAVLRNSVGTKKIKNLQPLIIFYAPPAPGQLKEVKTCVVGQLWEPISGLNKAHSACWDQKTEKSGGMWFISPSHYLADAVSCHCRARIMQYAAPTGQVFSLIVSPPKPHGLAHCVCVTDRHLHRLHFSLSRVEWVNPLTVGRRSQTLGDCNACGRVHRSA